MTKIIEIDETKINDSIAKLIKQEDSLKNYLKIQAELEKGNCSKNKDLQVSFWKLYDNRRLFLKDSKKEKEYFSIMEKYYKKFKEGNTIDFMDLFIEIEKQTGKRSLVYTSKMLHTIDNKYPIWDSVLVGVTNFNLNNTPASKLDNYWVEFAYKHYCQLFESFMKSKEGKMIIKEFDKKFGNVNHLYVDSIGDVKKIDFVLWKNK